MNPLVLVLAITILISPFFIAIAARQDKKIKHKLKTAWIFLLASQLLLGFFNWERFSGPGRSGFELALIFPGSILLSLFFLISVSQIILLLSKKTAFLSVWLNFLNTIIFFLAMTRISNILGVQIVSLASITVVFSVLIGNVAGLLFINKDPRLLSKTHR